MSLTQYRQFGDPWSDFDRTFGLSNWGDWRGRKEFGNMWSPQMDITEKDNKVLLHMELPGLKKENIAIELDKGLLTISGEKLQEKISETDKCFRSERSFGKFSRSITVPKEVTEESIQAKFENGVLEIAFPKESHKGRLQPKQIKLA